MLAGRRLLDAIIDVRTPRLTLIIRNAFGGAYATFMVLAAPLAFLVLATTTPIRLLLRRARQN